MLLAAQFAQTNRSDDFFGMERKIAVHHPRIVARLDPEHLGYRASLVLTETEHFHAFVVIDDTASKIDILRPGRELGQEIDIVLDVYKRQFPDDATANQNAANAAMGKGDMTNAERYLSKRCV